MSDPTPDPVLIASIQEQQAWAFEVLFERYAPAIRRHLHSIVRDAPATEDLLQETYLRVWTRAGQWNGQGAVKGWLFRIATNLALNHLRTRKRRPKQPPAQDYPAPEADHIPCQFSASLPLSGKARPGAPAHHWLA